MLRPRLGAVLVVSLLAVGCGAETGSEESAARTDTASMKGAAPPGSSQQGPRKWDFSEAACQQLSARTVTQGPVEVVLQPGGAIEVNGGQPYVVARGGGPVRWRSEKEWAVALPPGIPAFPQKKTHGAAGQAGSLQAPGAGKTCGKFRYSVAVYAAPAGDASAASRVFVEDPIGILITGSSADTAAN